MNHSKQNTLTACAYMLGITVQELIEVLHNASSVKEIKTIYGTPFVLPSKPTEIK